MKKTGWIGVRWKKLPYWASTSEVAKTLKFNIRTLWVWLADPYFQRNQIAVKEEDGWHWDKEKLPLWLIAMGAAKPAQFPRSRRNPDVDGDDDNPPRLVRDKRAAREKLGMPEEHVVVRSRARDLDEEDSEERDVL